MALDLKMVRLKNVANDVKINMPRWFFLSVFVEKIDNVMFYVLCIVQFHELIYEDSDFTLNSWSFGLSKI